MVRIRRTSLAVLLLSCALLLAAGPASAEETSTYAEGIVDVPFSFNRLGEGMTIDPGDKDQTLILQLDGLPGGTTTVATSGVISGVFELGGEPAQEISFRSFRVRMDYDTSAAVSVVVRFTSKARGTFSGQAQGHEDLLTGEWVFPVAQRSDGYYPGGSLLRYKLAFTVPNAGAVGTITVYDVSLDYGEYVDPPEPDYGSGGDGDGSKNHGARDQPSGIAYMGGSDGSRSSGSGDSGTGSGQAGRGNSAGTDVAAGTGSIDTDAPVATSPGSTAGDTVTGYPLRLEDVLSPGAGPGGESGDGVPPAGAAASGGGRAGLSWPDLTWIVVALAVTAPFVAAELDRRRVRRRLRRLVEATPDGPAPRATAPA